MHNWFLLLSELEWKTDFIKSTPPFPVNQLDNPVTLTYQSFSLVIDGGVYDDGICDWMKLLGCIRELAQKLFHCFNTKTVCMHFLWENGVFSRIVASCWCYIEHSNGSSRCSRVTGRKRHNCKTIHVIRSTRLAVKFNIKRCQFYFYSW